MFYECQQNCDFENDIQIKYTIQAMIVCLKNAQTNAKIRLQVSFPIYVQVSNKGIYKRATTRWQKLHQRRPACSPKLPCPTFSHIPEEERHTGPHLVWRSLEDAGTLVDCLRPQADVFVLQLLCCAVHGFGDEAAFWHLALRVQQILSLVCLPC